MAILKAIVNLLSKALFKPYALLMYRVVHSMVFFVHSPKKKYAFAAYLPWVIWYRDKEAHEAWRNRNDGNKKSIREKKFIEYALSGHNHERNHHTQQIEPFLVGVMLVLFIGIFTGWWILATHIGGFVILSQPLIYFGHYFYLGIFVYKFKDWNSAYRNVAMELEAYANDNNLNYLKTRIPFAWITYFFKKKYDNSSDKKDN